MRGVDVALLVPEKCDHFYLTHVMRSSYDDLLPHGVRIFNTARACSTPNP